MSHLISFLKLGISSLACLVLAIVSVFLPISMSLKLIVVFVFFIAFVVLLVCAGLVMALPILGLGGSYED
jgi:hypothetical protein